MFELSIHISPFDLSRHEVEIDCPLCTLHNWATFGQIQRREVLICRGCHSNIFLEDHLGSTQRSIKIINDAFKQFGSI